MKKNKNTSIIQLNDLELAYGEKLIVKNLNLNIHKGEFVSITGKSGAGKSTLLYSLGGFLKPKSGTYLFESQQVYRLGEIGLGGFRKKNIGYLFQDFRLLPFLTVEKNILFPMYFTGERYKKSRVQEIMSALGLTHRASAYPRDISGGEAQRTALARAMMLNPKVLLLDEPTGNLDKDTEKEILNQLLELKKSGLTLICVTHSATIIQHSDRVITLKNHEFSEKTGARSRKVQS
jgi:putative ABC transport system ATP-binding protein